MHNPGLIQEWLKEEDFDCIIYGVFFGENIDFVEFKKILMKLLANIAEIRKTPMDKREFEDWG